MLQPVAICFPFCSREVHKIKSNSSLTFQVGSFFNVHLRQGLNLFISLHKSPKYVICTGLLHANVNQGQICVSVQPHNLWESTNYHLQATSYSLVSPLRSCLDTFSQSYSFPLSLCHYPLWSASLFLSLALAQTSSHSLMHFSPPVASPSFNRYHYRGSVLSLFFNTVPSERITVVHEHARASEQLYALSP